jgi:hypothetical protein
VYEAKSCSESAGEPTKLTENLARGSTNPVVCRSRGSPLTRAFPVRLEYGTIMSSFPEQPHTSKTRA